ncbi:hypothetical protein QBC35DRAFT_62866 [Podospora australis]|uniref:C3H1-type domain-containing protein n=1 Tax=Podospora australis TaxID=1536484 RepID=A0AAN6WYR6_9PEZI|nr:hypothetical protein QBC35DRAFT_62866 [Podospora australis]
MSPESPGSMAQPRGNDIPGKNVLIGPGQPASLTSSMQVQYPHSQSPNSPSGSTSGQQVSPQHHRQFYRPGFANGGPSNTSPQSPNGAHYPITPHNVNENRSGHVDYNITLSPDTVGYCFVRPNGARTRLIPADMLPFSIAGIPAQENDNLNLAELPIPMGRGPDGKSSNLEKVTLATHQRSRHTDAVQAITQSNSPGRANKPPKVYCDKWVHEGVCAFTQQGCRYKHEMPMDRATQHALGLYHGLPPWWRKAQAELAREERGAVSDAPIPTANYPPRSGVSNRGGPQTGFGGRGGRLEQNGPGRFEGPGGGNATAGVRTNFGPVGSSRPVRTHHHENTETERTDLERQSTDSEGTSVTLGRSGDTSS